MTTTLEKQDLYDLSKLGIDSPFKKRYDNFIGGKFIPPVKGQYFANVSPIVGHPFTEIARSTAEDIELALDAAHAAKDKWGKRRPPNVQQFSIKIADRMEANLAILALAETIDNGKPIRESTRGRHSACHRSLPLFCRLRSARKKAASRISITIRSPTTSMSLSALSGKSFLGISRSSWRPGSLHPRLPPVTASYSNPPNRRRRRSWYGSTSLPILATGRPQCRQRFRIGSRHAVCLESARRQDRVHRLDYHRPRYHAVRSQNLIPVTLELGGKSPNIFFADVLAQDDDFFDKASKASRCSRLIRAKFALARHVRSCTNRSMTGSWNARSSA